MNLIKAAILVIEMLDNLYSILHSVRSIDSLLYSVAIVTLSLALAVYFPASSP